MFGYFSSRINPGWFWSLHAFLVSQSILEPLASTAQHEERVPVDGKAQSPRGWESTKSPWMGKHKVLTEDFLENVP